MTRKKSFTPYANEADVLEVGKLMLENRVDRITVSGDVDLTADKQGLQDARRLHDILGAIVAALESRELPDRLPPPDVETVANPFN
jgi:hypothetical protein